ncbi:MAG: hypothetical protein HY670_10155 [Chloroflexi bacterium]|nr:hypothetical protein [Chloroflexota bacterium]
MSISAANNEHNVRKGRQNMTTLDEILGSKARFANEQSDASTGFACLYDIMQRMDETTEAEIRLRSGEIRRYREYMFDIETKANYLLLIISRLRETIKSPFFRPAGVRTRTIDYFLIDLETFLYYTISILDLVARLTPYFYPSSDSQFKHNSWHFSWQRQWFRNNCSFDPEYRRNLMEMTPWFEELNEHRNNLAHDRSAFFLWGKNPPKLFFGTKRNSRDFIPNQDALQYANETANGLMEFLCYFNGYFGKKR